MRDDKAARGLRNLVQFLHHRYENGFVMVEIGSYAGESTEIFAQHASKIYAVDPWVSGYDPNDIASNSDMILAEKEFDHRMQKYANIKKLKMTSAEAINSFEDQSVDIVYIDGNHTYDAVKFDIQSWLPKIKLNGMVAGHDYYHKGVNRAIHYTIGKPDLVFEDKSWLKSAKEAQKSSLLKRISYRIFVNALFIRDKAKRM